MTVIFERVHKRFKHEPKLSDLRNKRNRIAIEIKDNENFGPRKFKAIPFVPKRFWGKIEEAEIESTRTGNSIFNFGHLYFLGTKEEYKKL
jgi:hypothetical protein